MFIKKMKNLLILSLSSSRYVAELEKSIVSVERIREYQSTPQEAAFELADIDPDPSWPPRGTFYHKSFPTPSPKSPRKIGQKSLFNSRRDRV